MLYYLIGFLVLLLAVSYFFKPSLQTGGRSKCYSCEAQDRSNGIYRDYGSKCIDCEVQDRHNGIIRNYGSKWF